MRNTHKECVKNQRTFSHTKHTHMFSTFVTNRFFALFQKRRYTITLCFVFVDGPSAHDNNHHSHSAHHGIPQHQNQKARVFRVLIAVAPIRPTPPRTLSWVDAMESDGQELDIGRARVSVLYGSTYG